MTNLTARPKKGEAGKKSDKLISKSFSLLFLSSILFIGGITLLWLKIPVLSIFLGLPSVQIGIIILILSFDEIAKQKVGIEKLHAVSCSICGRLTLTPLWQKKDICEKCQEKISKKNKTKP